MLFYVLIVGLFGPSFCFLLKVQPRWKKSIPFSRLYSTATETATLPAPKVPASAWKWPPAWPFPEDYMEIMVDTSTYSSKPFTNSQAIAFRNHIKYYLEPGIKILEIGAQSEAMLSNSEISKGSSIEYMSFAALGGTGSNTLKIPVADVSIDTVIISTGIEALSNPREAFRDIWRVLKPRGKCLICFAGSPNVVDLQPIKMWTTMTEEQKIWIAGSYYQYSAGQGWENIEGFDVLGVSGSKEMVFEKAQGDTAYVVQACKYETPTLENSESLESLITKLMVMMQNLNSEAKDYCSLRLAADYSKATTEMEKQKILESIPRLESIYAVLNNLQDAVVPAPIKALLANRVIPNWVNCPEQLEALRKGLGMETADEYWIELGKNSGLITPRTKILLLGEIVSYCGVNAKVKDVPALMGAILDVLRKRFPGVDEKTLQTYTVELVISDYLNSRNSKERVLSFVNKADVTWPMEKNVKLEDKEKE